MTLSVKNLERLIVLVKTGSFQRASEELSISQPALSKNISKMERDLGVRLLERHARGVIPTTYATVLLNHIRPILAGLHSAELELRSMRGGVCGCINIGLAPTAADFFAPLIVDNLKKENRSYRLSVVKGLAGELIQKTLKGELDFSITTYSESYFSPDLISKKLYEDKFLVCCANGFKADLDDAKNTAINLKKMKWVLAPAGGLLRNRFETYFHKLELDPPIPEIETFSVSLSKELILNHGFFSFLPSRIFTTTEKQRGVRVFPLDWICWRRPISLIYRRSQIMSPAQKYMIDLFKELSSKLNMP